VSAPTAYKTSLPVRRLLFGIGGLATVVMVLWGALHVLDALSIRDERDVSSFAGVRAVDLRNAHGDVEVVPARGDRVRVTVESRTGLFGGRGRSDEVRGSELRLRGGCHLVTVGTCREDYRIEVPAGVSVDVQTTAGEATARGVRGDLELRSSAGRVRAVDVRASEIFLRSSAGSVTAENVLARDLTVRSSAGGVEIVRSAGRTVEAGTSAGPVDVELIRPPLTLDASSSAGGVEVVVPDVGYDVDAQTSAGEEVVEVRQRPGSARRIRVDSSAGNVTVRPLSRSRPESRQPR
jgi:hypothetical protein